MRHITISKWLSVMLVVLMVAAAIGCGKKEAEKPTPTPTMIPTPTATPSEPSGETGSLSGVIGDVQVLRSWSSSWVAAASGMKLGTGDSLKTGGDGYVLITFFDGSVMEMNASTEISVEELSKASGGSTTVNLSQIIGNTLNRVENLIDSSSTYEVGTAAVSMVVRGTIVVIQVDQNGRTIISVVDEGDVEKHFVYVTAGGVTVILYEGMTLAIEVGGIPGTPFYTNPLDDPNQYNTGDGLGAGGWQSSPISAYAPSEVWVDASYNPNSYGGHTWGYDAFDKIQDGINAVSGSIVHVAAATYYENIILKDGVQVIADNGPTVTIIDGMQNGSVVSATNISSTSRLEGFTITNGSIPSGFGAGMYNFNSSPIITNCIFRDNSGFGGGGICNHLGSSPVITNCTFRNNSASAGAGMFNYYSSSPVITSCTFENNSATGLNNWGGALVNLENSSPVISSCILSHNSAILAGGIGNGNSSSPVITNCILFNNLASHGAGMLNIDCSPVITNCTLWNNSASIYGSGIYNSNSSPVITNCIMWDNPPSEIYNQDISCTPIVTYSDIITTYPGIGNINVLPSFVNAPGGDFHINDGQCLNTGNNSAPFMPSTDFEGNPRICPAAGGTVDIGAYEVCP